jgi:hypothetical protein
MAASATKPPGFKEEVKVCADCSFWDGKGLCLLPINGSPANWPADDDSVCDSFKAIAETDDVKGRLWKAHRRRLERTK